MAFKSNTEEKVREALKNDERAWRLDAGTSGNDDVMLGTLDEVLSDVWYWIAEDETPDFHIGELPTGWSIAPVFLSEGELETGEWFTPAGD